LLPPPEEESTVALADYIPTLVSRLWHFPTVSVTATPPKIFAPLFGTVRGAGNGNLRLAPAGKVRHSVTYRDITIEPFRINLKNFLVSRAPGALPCMT